MDKGLIPARYAKALYEVALERNDSDKLYATMGRLSAAFAAEPKLAATIANPFVAEADKLSLLSTASGVAEGSDATFADFLKLLCRNRRIDMVWDIARAYIALYRREHGIYRVDVVSAAPLADAARKRLEAIIKENVGKGTMEYDYTVDPALIGGFKVTVDNKRLDASVATRLAKLRQTLVD